MTSNDSDNDDGYKHENILPSGRLSPTLGHSDSDLQQALLDDESWDEGGRRRSGGGDLKKDLSEIETSKRLESQFV